MYHVEDKKLIGKPYANNFLEGNCTFIFNDTPIAFQVLIIHKSNDPIKGEVKETLNILPEITCALQDNVIILKIKKVKQLQLPFVVLHHNPTVR